MKEIKLQRRKNAPDFTPRTSPVVKIKTDREYLESLYSHFEKALIELRKSCDKIERENLYTWMVAMMEDFPQCVKMNYIIKNEVINK
jgi:hypothetical protein